MVHFPALPGTPLYDEKKGLDFILNSINSDLKNLQNAGVDAVMFGNENDRPYELNVNKASLSTMAFMIGRVKDKLKIPFGVNVLWDPISTIALAASTNDLKLTLTHYPKAGTDDVGQTDSWMVHNISLKKWCHIFMSTNNRAVDTYIDGKLVNTHVLAGVPKTDAEAPVLLTPDDGFSGETSKFRYIARSINPREPYEIYREGPGGNWFTDLLSQYKLKFSFLKNNEEVNSFEI